MLGDFYWGRINLEALSDSRNISELLDFHQEVVDESNPSELKLRVPGERVLDLAEKLQKQLKDSSRVLSFAGENGSALIVIFQDQIFILPKNRDYRWKPVLDHALARGIASDLVATTSDFL